MVRLLLLFSYTMAAGLIPSAGRYNTQTLGTQRVPTVLIAKHESYSPLSQTIGD